MYDELTPVDIQKMKEEIEYRVTVLRPKLIEDVKTAREWGDLSENFEYKAAKREKNRNESRIRFLENMIKTARVYEDKSDENTIGLYDSVTLWLPEDEEEEVWQIVTTVRQDPLHGLISKESPAGRALLGKSAGDTVFIQVNKDFGYEVVVRAIEKGQDDGSAQLNEF
jgi:transcription elongation factor GreA